MRARKGERRPGTMRRLWVVALFLVILLFAAVVEGANKRNFDATRVVQSADIKQVEYSSSLATEWYGYQKKKLRRYKKKLRRYAQHVVWNAPEYVLTILVMWCLQRWFVRNFTRVR